MSDYKTPDLGFGNLSIFYTHQFVSNEPLDVEWVDAEQTVGRYVFGHGPVIQGTITGKIVRGDEDIQYFTVKMTDELELKDIGIQGIRVVGGTLDRKKGSLTLLWSGTPGSNRVIASYEYDVDREAS